MIHICRAEDGEIFEVEASLRDIELLGLELFVNQHTGIEEAAVLAYLSDGRRLRNDNIRELAGVQDQSIFVFNKFYLDFDINEVLHELRIAPALQPPVEESISATPPYRPSELGASYLRISHVHHEHIRRLVSSLEIQSAAAHIASSSLDLNALAISDAWETVSSAAQAQLDRQTFLLQSVDADLWTLSRSKVHVEFLTPAHRKAIEGTPGAHRTLADYVSNAKMRQVADACQRIHDDMLSRFRQVEDAMKRLVDGAGEVRGTMSNTRHLNDAEAHLRQADDILDRVTSYAGALEGPTRDSTTILQELKQLDASLRSEVQTITNAKNAYTEQIVHMLRQISQLNNDVVQLPTMLTDLQTQLRPKNNSFMHVQRLHNMLYAYGATVIEVVRRKEFARFFYQRSSSILEVMAQLSANERRRRQTYRSEVHGQLPFDIKGMDDAVPTVDFSPSAGPESPYALERTDIEDLLRMLDGMIAARGGGGGGLDNNNNAVVRRSVEETRAALQKLVDKMDGLESGFDRIAERSLLSASRLSWSRRRANEIDEQAYNDLANQLSSTQDRLTHQESLLAEERSTFHADLHMLRSTNQSLEASLAAERERATRLERELAEARTQLETALSARRIVEERSLELSTEAEGRQHMLAQALAEATRRTREAEELKQELAQMHADFQDVKALEERSAQRIATLVAEQAETLRHLEEARGRGEDLAAQIRNAREEGEDVTRTLREAAREKDRLLRAQASEHDRKMKELVNEADGDRAVLEHQFSELKAQFDDVSRRLRDKSTVVDAGRMDSDGLRRVLEDARLAEKSVRNELASVQSVRYDLEHRLENGSHLAAQLLDVAIAFRNSHVKALAVSKALSTHPGVSKMSSTLVDSILQGSPRDNNGNVLDNFLPAIDPSDPNVALETLRAIDHDHFLETISKTGSVIRKWQKQCKEYRERAKGKISFRNFAKGDLALFLPTRNSISKPWAAFNVSFPHYFLQATGHLAEQLKTREWIVARITSITERVVDRNDPTSNPYGLGEGVKYYMLEVEDWTQPNQTRGRKGTTARRASSETAVTHVTTNENAVLLTPPPAAAETIPFEPPEAEVEESFRVSTRSRSVHAVVPGSGSSARVASSPPARPSSLSRLLAQAATETIDNVDDDDADQSKDASTSLPAAANVTDNAVAAITPPSNMFDPQPSPSLVPEPSPSTPSISPKKPSASGSGRPTHQGLPSPLRPGSRASRISFSGGRLPPLVSHASNSGLSKAAATTALSDTPLSSSPTGLITEVSSGSEGTKTVTDSSDSPSPSQSISEGMSANVFWIRQRTASTNSPLNPSVSKSTSGTVTSPTSTTFSPFSNWGFGKKKKSTADAIQPVKSDLAHAAASSSSSTRTSLDRPMDVATAADLLKQFEC